MDVEDGVGDEGVGGDVEVSAWKTASLGEIFDIARGGSPRPIQDYITDDEDGVNWISISDASASDKFITETKKRIRPEGVSRSRMVKPGDFLLTNSMSFGRPYIMGTSGCIHDGWLVLSSKHGDVDQDYFFHLLGSDFIYAKFTKLAAGATVKNLNIDLVSGVEVNFPPLEEQRRIAAILDQAETLRTQRRQALAHLDTLTQSLFLEMFGDDAQGAPRFPVATLVDVLETPLQNGAYYPKEEYTEKGGVEMVHMSDAFQGIVRRGALKRVNCSEADLKKYSLGVADILLARRSLTYEGAAKPCLIPPATEPLLFESSFIRVTPDRTKLLPLYVLHYLNNETIRDKRVRPFVTQSTISGINQSNLERVPVVVPPLALQQTFATRIQAIEALKATHRTALAQLRIGNSTA